MAHAHAHLADDGFQLQSHSSASGPSGSACPSPSITASPARILAPHTQRSPLEGTSPHARRLQLRNAGFRAPLLPGRKVSPTLALAQRPESFKDSFYVSCSYSEELPLAAQRKPSLNGAGGGAGRGRISPSSILREISNSATKRLPQGRPPQLGAIFQENVDPNTPLADSSNSRRSRDGRSFSPSAKEGMENEALLLDASPAMETTTSDMPQPRQLKVRKKSRTCLRSSSFEANKYIEHLESELASVNARLDNLTSPTSTKAQAARLRTLAKQVQSLRQEVSDWEQRFEERVGDEVYRRTNIEADLRAQIKQLEQEAEGKDMRLQDMEQELNNAHDKLEASELLESNLERRVDVLTELLAQSPTRLNFSSTASIGASDSVKKARRPQSVMLPRLMTSPVLTPSSRRHWQARDLEQTMASIEGTIEHPASPLGDYYNARDSRLSIYSSQSGSTRDCSEYDTSNQSAPSSSSRPTSYVSNSSGWSSWGVPLPPDGAVRSESRPRKMRRFKSGSTNLKPLLLPATAALPSLPVSAPMESDHESSFREPLTEVMDPKSAPLPQARYRDGSPSPSHSRTFQKYSTALIESLHETDTQVDETAPNEEIPPEDEVETLPSTAMTTYAARKPQSLRDELEDAQALAIRDDDEGLERENTLSLGTIRANTIRAPRSNLDGLLMDRSLIVSPCCSAPDNLDITPKAPKRRRSDRNLGPTNLMATSPVVPMSVEGFMNRILSFVASLRRDALASAKIILANSWNRSSSAFGGLAWWLVGLVYGSRNRIDNIVAAHHRTDIRRNSRHGNYEMHQQLDKFLNSACSCNSDAERRNGRCITNASSTLNPNEHFSCDGRLTSTSARLRKAKSELTMRRWNHTPTQAYNTTNLGDPATITERRPPRQGKEAANAHVNSPQRCGTCTEPLPSQKLKLWYKFSLAIVLAIGIAVLEGPETLLLEGNASQQSSFSSPSHTKPFSENQQHEPIPSPLPCQSSSRCIYGSRLPRKNIVSSLEEDDFMTPTPATASATAAERCESASPSPETGIFPFGNLMGGWDYDDGHDGDSRRRRKGSQVTTFAAAAAAEEEGMRCSSSSDLGDWS